MTEEAFNPEKKQEEEKEEYTLLNRTEEEPEEEFVERIVEEYKDIDSDGRNNFKQEVRLYLYKEKGMLDKEMEGLLEENPKVIGSWRRENGLEPNHWERKHPRRKDERSRNNYHRTKREKDLVVRLVVAALNYRKDPEHSSEKPINLRKLSDNN